MRVRALHVPIAQTQPAHPHGRRCSRGCILRPHGCWAIGVKLSEDVPTVGDIFQQHGYESILIGKAHFQPLKSEPGGESIERQPIFKDLDYWRNFYGPWYGFNHIETARMHANESHVGQHYALWMEEKGLKNWQDYFVQFPRPRR